MYLCAGSYIENLKCLLAIFAGGSIEFFFCQQRLGALISHTIETRRMLQKIVSDSDLWTMLILWL